MQGGRKMILIIDTIDKNCWVGLQIDKKLYSKKWQWRKDTGTEVLENIDKLLKENSKNLSDIESILVNQGPGSYTGTRVGITIANTLVWSLNIPVYGYKKETYKKVLEKISKKSKKNFSSITLPYYS